MSSKCFLRYQIDVLLEEDLSQLESSIWSSINTSNNHNIYDDIIEEDELSTLDVSALDDFLRGADTASSIGGSSFIMDQPALTSSPKKPRSRSSKTSSIRNRRANKITTTTPRKPKETTTPKRTRKKKTEIPTTSIAAVTKCENYELDDVIEEN